MSFAHDCECVMLMPILYILALAGVLCPAGHLFFYPFHELQMAHVIVKCAETELLFWWEPPLVR